MSSDAHQGASSPDWILQHIRDLYNANMPLYTKDAIQKVAEALRFCEQSRSDRRKVVTVTLPGIDGRDHKMDVNLPRKRPTPSWAEFYLGSQLDAESELDSESQLDPEEELTDLSIYYRTAHSMTTDDHFSVEEAYLPMMITPTSYLMLPSKNGRTAVQVYSAEQLRIVFHSVERRWKAGPHYAQVEATLAAIPSLPALNKVVGLALGPLLTGTTVEFRVIMQHVLLSALQTILLRLGALTLWPLTWKSTWMTTATCGPYIQDPIYMEPEKEVLCAAGFTILEDPQALLVLDDSSVLVTINASFPIKQIVADTCRPGIIFWERGDRDRTFSNSHSSRVDEMLEKEYYQWPFPPMDALRDLVMYVRKR
ncbi:hypothetical protein F5Y17DRAFT_310825 [Xylariaceae sp. FL0594]|nr:hypothetical protein F5Y17DRAFT_310825 [Xylariaceae sp. FL0594]